MCGLDISKIYAYETFTCIKDDLVVIFVVVVYLMSGKSSVSNGYASSVFR